MNPSRSRMAARDSFSLEPGIFTESNCARFALRRRVSMSAIGSVIVIGSPPRSPARLGHARDLPGVDHRPKTDPAEAELAVDGLRPTAALAPRVRADLELRRPLLLVPESLLRHRSARLLSEWEPEGREEGTALGVGAGGGHDRDVEPPRRVDLVVLDLREDQLVVDAHRVVAVAVERPGRQPAEVADPRDREADQPVEELPRPIAAERDLDADRHPLSELEVRDRPLGARHHGLLPGDLLDVALGALDEGGLRHGPADARADHDLDQPGYLHDVLEPELV